VSCEFFSFFAAFVFPLFERDFANANLRGFYPSQRRDPLVAQWPAPQMPCSFSFFLVCVFLRSLLRDLLFFFWGGFFGFCLVGFLVDCLLRLRFF